MKTIQVTFLIAGLCSFMSTLNGQSIADNASKLEWNEPDWRTVDGIRECVWTDKGWRTFVGVVRQGLGYRELNVSGYLLVEGNSLQSVFGLDDNSAESISRRGGWMHNIRGNVTNGWLVGENMAQFVCILRGYPKEPRINETFIIRVKPTLQHSDDPFTSHWKVILEYGSVPYVPAGGTDSTLEAQRKGVQDMTTAYLLALNTALSAHADSMTPKVKSPQEEADEKAEKDTKRLLSDIENATNGCVSCQYRLGMRYLKGDGVTKEDTIGRQWLEKAAAQGDFEAKRALAALSYKIDLGNIILMKELNYALQDADSYQYKLGMRFLNGDGVDQNKAFAKDWLDKAARNGNADAKNVLSTLSP